MAPAPAMIPQIVQTPNGQQIVMQQVFAQPQFQQAPQFAQVQSENYFFVRGDLMYSCWIFYNHNDSGGRLEVECAPNSNSVDRILLGTFIW